mmetsp:Transcript_4227/g.15959  ORF Transcript_4227/g.15959 Transcript_4227/m.15959 type:complete len:126 (-) Transcript_4227:270-647(-)
MMEGSVKIVRLIRCMSKSIPIQSLHESESFYSTHATGVQVKSLCGILQVNNASQIKTSSPGRFHPPPLDPKESKTPPNNRVSHHQRFSIDPCRCPVCYFLGASFLRPVSKYMWGPSYGQNQQEFP